GCAGRRVPRRHRLQREQPDAADGLRQPGTDPAGRPLRQPRQRGIGRGRAEPEPDDRRRRDHRPDRIGIDGEGSTPMSKLAKMDLAELEDELARLEADLTLTRGNRIKLDLTRGKPAADQLDLSAPMDDVLQGNYLAEDGTDSRNY